jgi:hypothetical protein
MVARPRRVSVDDSLPEPDLYRQSILAAIATRNAERRALEPILLMRITEDGRLVKEATDHVAAS